MLAARLKQDGLNTFVAGVDANNVPNAVDDVTGLTPAALAALGRLNTHDYHADPSGSPAKLIQYRELARSLHKPIWMSELGCCFHGQGDGTDMWGALFMADAVRMDLRDMGADAWVLWQPDWNVIAFDPHGGMPQPQTQYYVLAQYTRFIRPGFQIISAGGAYHTLAAYSPASKRLVLVTTNRERAEQNDLDLGNFAGLPVSVEVYRTTDDTGIDLQPSHLALTSTSHIVDQLPVRSVTTYVVDGVTPRPVAASARIEGPHQIKDVGTGLCLNIPRNATNAGAGIIPYPCGGGFSNMEFNLVDEANEFYTIQTTNGADSLCLNISQAATSPGDGKTLGVAGNLIQWSCQEGSPYPNELFQVVALASNRMTLRVKSSGLCLEDPGRGGTLRQDVCRPSQPDQIFTLTD